VPGMTTNTSWQTTSTYPGAQPGLTTNFTVFSTVVNYPGPQPMLTTNCSTTVYKVKDRPTSGYCGTPWQTGNDVNWWYYYGIAGYNYASGFSYSYATYTYNYTSYTYNYVVYITAPTYTTNHYDHVLGNGDYYVSDASGLSGTTIVTGNARLVMGNGLNMSGNDQMTIAPGGGLQMYSAGDTVTIGGNGVLNKTGNAANFMFYGTPSVTTLNFNGNGEFTGVLVMPNANTKMNGGGYDVNDFVGSLMVNSVQMNGHFNFHYDEALARVPSNGRFLITSWNEIP